MSNIPFDLDEILRRVAAIESSNGANVNHAVIDNPKSVHYGKSAIGTYALMPKTAYDQVQQDDDLADLRGMDEASLRQMLGQDEEVQRRVASELLRDLMRQFPGSPEQVVAAYYSGPEAAYRMQKGQPLKPDEARHVKRFQNVPPARRGAPQLAASALPEAPAAPPLPVEPPPQPAPSAQRPAPARQPLGLMQDPATGRYVFGDTPQAGGLRLEQQGGHPLLTNAPPVGLDGKPGAPVAMEPDIIRASADPLQMPYQFGSGASMRALQERGEFAPETHGWMDAGGRPGFGGAPDGVGERPASDIFDQPPDFLDSVRVALGQPPAGAGGGGAMGGGPSMDEMTRRILASQPAGATERPDAVLPGDMDADASASFGRFRSWGQGADWDAPAPAMPPLSPSEHGKAWATPPREFSDPRSMFMRDGASPGTLSDYYQEPAPERVKDAEMALAYHMKSYDPVGLLTAEQRQRSLNELTGLMSPQERPQEHMLMGLGRAFAAGGHAAGVEPLSRAFGVVEGERARQDALAAQQDQQRRAQVNDLTQLLAQDRQAQALDYQINKPQDTITMPGMPEMPANMANEVTSSMFNLGKGGRYEAEQASLQDYRNQQLDISRQGLDLQREKAGQLDAYRNEQQAAAEARELNDVAYQIFLQSANENKASNGIKPVLTRSQAMAMAQQELQRRRAFADPNAPADLNAAIEALGAKLVTNEQPAAAGAATQVASGQMIDPKTGLPPIRR